MKTFTLEIQSFFHLHISSIFFLNYNCQICTCTLRCLCNLLKLWITTIQEQDLVKSSPWDQLGQAHQHGQHLQGVHEVQQHQKHHGHQAYPMKRAEWDKLWDLMLPVFQAKKEFF